jgi:hypothetical protein
LHASNIEHHTNAAVSLQGTKFETAANGTGTKNTICKSKHIFPQGSPKHEESPTLQRVGV